MPYYLLTGAGFTRNWGGWLASEAFEYLLGAHEVNEYLRDILWNAKLRGEGFEGALSTVQDRFTSTKSPQDKAQLEALTEAVISMFSAMQVAFSNQRFDNQNYGLREFLSGFDSIFTLNQDTFLETHYAGPVRWTERWYGSYLPYMRFIKEPSETYPHMLREPMMQEPGLSLLDSYQPIYKLHGSYNWFAEPNGDRLLVMGGNKTSLIKAFPVLGKYQEEFERMLSEPNTHLMIIGYSFGDSHINDVIMNAAKRGMKTFIIDPIGVDVIDKRSTRALIQEPLTNLMDALMPSLTGASRRPLKDIIYSDEVEFGKVMRFFEGQPKVSRIKRQLLSDVN